MNENTGKNLIFYFPPQETLISKNLHLFLLDYYKVVDLFFFTIHLAFNADNVSATASKALISIAKSDEERQRYQETLDNPKKAMNKLTDFSELNSKNLTITIVDSFLWFISAKIQSAMKKRPEMIRSGETIKVEDIFEFSNKKELINYLIDRKVSSLSYGGMSKVEKFISESMGINLFPDNDSRNLMQIFVEIRNIHVHNRGLVNRIFLSRTVRHEKFQFSEGKIAHLNLDELVEMTQVCVQSAINLDKKICKKFNIKQKRYSTWNKNTASPKSLAV